MSANDINDFIESVDHETRASGSITFESFEGQSPATFPLVAGNSFFQYLRVNPGTGEAEMRYHLEFDSRPGRRVVFEGRKYMQKDEAGGLRGFQELLEDYTTLFVHVSVDGTEIGTGYLKFRTFENIAAFGSMIDFLASFRVKGHDDDPLLQLRAQMKFAAFTGQFVQREYDPAGNTTGNLRDDVSAEVLRGAASPISSPPRLPKRSKPCSWREPRSRSTSSRTQEPCGSIFPATASSAIPSGRALSPKTH